MLKQTTPKIVSPHLLNPIYKKILIAVSGGSDSLALMYLCAENSQLDIHVATVDHGLRVEAAKEAEYVRHHCELLKIPHAILRWHPDKATSHSARLARYNLLAEHARKSGSEAILLGHTLDDQAETLLMRANRVATQSGTRGLSGMPETASYESLKLVRPLLNIERESLRQYLRGKQIGWIEDPSNENPKSERVRTRRLLRNGLRDGPSPHQIARLASLSARHRHWLNQVSATYVEENTAWDGCSLKFSGAPMLPKTVLLNIFSVLALAVGGQSYRPPDAKLNTLVEAYQLKTSLRATVARCLITTKRNSISFSRENRNLPPLPSRSGRPEIYDGRWKINEDGAQTPFVTALERFRPASDDCIYKALMNVLSRPTSAN